MGGGSGNPLGGYAPVRLARHRPLGLASVSKDPPVSGDAGNGTQPLQKSLLLAPTRSKRGHPPLKHHQVPSLFLVHFSAPLDHHYHTVVDIFLCLHIQIHLSFTPIIIIIRLTTASALVALT